MLLFRRHFFSTANYLWKCLFDYFDNKKASGSLPTSGWTNSAQVLLSSITLYANDGDTGVKALNKSINSAYYNYTGLWEFLANGKPGTQTSSPSSIISIAGKKYRKIPFVQWSNMVLYIDQNGNLFSGTKKSYLSGVDLKALDGLPVYTISDTSITANTSVKMYLTDEGGVKAQSKASGSITVILPLASAFAFTPPSSVNSIKTSLLAVMEVSEIV